MTSFSVITKDGEPDSKDKKALSEGLLLHHSLNGHTRVTETHSIFFRDEHNEPLAGIILSFLWNGMKIESLWVKSTLRVQGMGTKLMKMAEAEGLKRGCSFAYTDTFTWQASDLYRKLGYEEYGKLDNFPEGNSLTYFRKEL